MGLLPYWAEWAVMVLLFFFYWNPYSFTFTGPGSYLQKCIVATLPLRSPPPAAAAAESRTRRVPLPMFQMESHLSANISTAGGLPPWSPRRKGTGGTTPKAAVATVSGWPLNSWVEAAVLRSPATLWSTPMPLPLPSSLCSPLFLSMARDRACASSCTLERIRCHR